MENEMIESVDVKETSNMNENKNGGNVAHKIFFTILAVTIFVFAWVFCEKIKRYGLDISTIRSVGGKTLEEAYYADVGMIYVYFAKFLKVFAGAMSGILLCVSYR